MAQELDAGDAWVGPGHTPSGFGPWLRSRSHPPRVIVAPPEEQLRHPLSKRDVQLVLSVLPPQSTAGLRSVSLLGARTRPDGAPVYASYRHAGFLRLHAVPPSPWSLPALPLHAAGEFRQYGALIEMLSDGGSRVTWPGDALRLFFTLGVMLPGVVRHRRELDDGIEREGDVRWLGSRPGPWGFSEAERRQWLDLLRGRGPV